MPSIAGPSTFLKHWFAGFARGLEELSGPERDRLLRACGRACADSYTRGVFLAARARGGDLPSFLELLEERFPCAHYALHGTNALEVTYAVCACDLVAAGLVRTPLLCGCSAHNLRENFEAALARPVAVELKASILAGAPACSFLVTWNETEPGGGKTADRTML